MDQLKIVRSADRRRKEGEGKNSK